MHEQECRNKILVCSENGGKLSLTGTLGLLYIRSWEE